MKEYNKEICAELLQEKSKMLAEKDILRLPQRSDFTTEEVVAIKACFGPWPRALEFAGLKQVNEEKLKKKKEKRIASNIKKRGYKIEAKQAKRGKEVE